MVCLLVFARESSSHGFLGAKWIFSIHGMFVGRSADFGPGRSKRRTPLAEAGESFAGASDSLEDTFGNLGDMAIPQEDGELPVVSTEGWLIQCCLHINQAS